MALSYFYHLQVFVFLSALATSHGFSWNFFFGTDYMGKTFIVQRDPQQGLLNRQTQSKEDTQTVKMKLEINNINRNKSKYLRIVIFFKISDCFTA